LPPGSGRALAVGRWRGERFGRYRCLTLRSLLLSVWVDPSAEHRGCTVHPEARLLAYPPPPLSVPCACAHNATFSHYYPWLLYTFLQGTSAIQAPPSPTISSLCVCTQRDLLIPGCCSPSNRALALFKLPLLIRSVALPLSVPYACAHNATFSHY